MKQKKAPWFIAKYGANPPKKFRRPINPISVKRRADKREYDRRRKKFLADYPLCRCCVVLAAAKIQPATQIHHCRGRRGSNYLDVKTWIGTCPAHHDQIHRDPKWAREHGFLGSFHV
jgi:hypothetical protein